MRPKDKGTAAETAVVKYLRTNGYPHAERRALAGNQDKGDILATAGLILEVKNVATATTGQPGATQLAAWMAEAEQERVNAGADLCPLIVKRKGTTDPGRWFAYLPLRDVATLLGTTDDSTAPVCLALADLTPTLRTAGYGTPTEETPGTAVQVGDPMQVAS